MSQIVFFLDLFKVIMVCGDSQERLRFWHRVRVDFALPECMIRRSKVIVMEILDVGQNPSNPVCEKCFPTVVFTTLLIFPKFPPIQRCDVFTFLFQKWISRETGFSRAMLNSLLQGWYILEEHRPVRIRHIPLNPVPTHYLVGQTAYRWTLTAIF